MEVAVTAPAAKPRIRVPAGSSRPGMSAAPEIETAHHAASRQARDMMSWPARRLSPDAALLTEIDTIAGRVDDLARNNGIASGAERTFTDNVIGPRFMCKPTPNRTLIGRDVKWAKTWSQIVAAEWETFANTTWFDAGLRHTFHDATRLVARSLCSPGEALALPMWISDDSRWKTRLMMIDPARLSTPRGMRDSQTMRGGIEMDASTGAAVAYHIRKAHPGDGYRIQAGAVNEWERIPAWHAFGRARVIHVFEPERFGQSRGKPIVTAVARQFKMLDHYHREQLRQAVLDSLVFAAVETPLDQATIVEMFAGSDDPMAAYQQSIAEWGLQMKGGAMIPMPPGTKLEAFSPQRQASSLATFTEVMLRHIATGLNMPYELVFRDFSKTNYSSARAALLEAWRYFLSVRQYLADHWAQAVYELWFEEAVNRGRIPDCEPRDFYGNRVAWTRTRWIGAGRGWVDPLKEAQAAQERLKTISTLEDEAAEQGKDWDDQLEQQAEENARASELGLPLPHRDRDGAALAPANDTTGELANAA